MDEDENKNELGLGIWRREDNCIVGDINSQRVVYVDVVKLHKVHK